MPCMSASKGLRCSVMNEILVTLAVFVVMAAAARIFDKPIRALLKRIVNSKFIKKLVLKHYVKKADRLFPGPKRGPEKHAYVTGQAERWQIKAGESVDEMITYIVSFLNQKSGSVKVKVEDKAGAVVDNMIDDITTGRKGDR